MYRYPMLYLISIIHVLFIPWVDYRDSSCHRRQLGSGAFYGPFYHRLQPYGHDTGIGLKVSRASTLNTVTQIQDVQEYWQVSYGPLDRLARKGRLGSRDAQNI